MGKRIVGIVGSYRKGGVVDSIVTEVLSAATVAGAATEKIYLRDANIEFCTNCRSCSQEEGEARGRCGIRDDMDGVLQSCDAADAIVLGAPVNFYNVNALTRRFMERLICYAYWPWSTHGPKLRSAAKKKKAVLVTSSAMPGFVARLVTGAPRALRIMAETLGARPISCIVAGGVAQQEHEQLRESIVRRAREAGRKLAA